MWGDLLRQIRSLHVTIRVERRNNDQTKMQSDTNNIASNPGPSTSAVNLSLNLNIQNETAKNFKKALLENYQRQNNENNHPRSYDPNQPSTSKGITSSERSHADELMLSSSNIEENSTNISLSSLLPSESELRRMQFRNLTEMLDDLYSRLTSCYRNCALSSNAQQFVAHDHTYSNLIPNNVQLPSMSSLISNIGVNSNVATVTAITTESALPSVSNINNSINYNSNTNRSTEIFNANINDTADDLSSINNFTNNNNNHNCDFGSVASSESSNNRSCDRSHQNLRQKIYLRYLCIF